MMRTVRWCAPLLVVATLGCTGASDDSADQSGSRTLTTPPTNGATSPGPSTTSPPSGTTTVPGDGHSSGSSTDQLIIAAGDIGTCDGSNDEATAALVAAHPTATVLTLGDTAYPDGTIAELLSCYHPSWGQHKARTRPAPGNHDYKMPGASGYYQYFGGAAGPAGKGYYSYDLGTWHIIALNSNCRKRGCEAGSEQEQWLRADLAANPRACTLAYWHHPRFSSGDHGGTERVEDLWRVLDAAGVDVVLNGHDHNYERFAPQNADAVADPRGIREFVVGTGGAELRPMKSTEPNSEVRADDTFGVLRMVLRAGAYDWRFLPVAGSTFTDSGTASCV